jgi:hypothetical protein
MVSLGIARSTTRTLWPVRARSIAVGDPAQRAPTTICVVMVPGHVPPLVLIVDAWSASAVSTEKTAQRGEGRTELRLLGRSR